MSTASPSHPEPSTPDGTTQRRKWLWTARLAGTALFGIAAAYYLIPREIANWHVAKAFQAVKGEDFPLAFEKIERAIRWNPKSALHYSQRASIHQLKKDFRAAVRDLSLAIDLEPGMADLFMMRSQVRQVLREFEPAVRDLDEYVRLITDGSLYFDEAKFRYASGLNARAYSRAVGNLEIAQGLADIDKAMQVLESLDEIQNPGETRSAFLDTRGYLLYLAGRFEEAKADLETAVGVVETQLKQLDAMAADAVDQEELRKARTRLGENLAVMLHHRGLNYAALQQNNAAEMDLKRATELGYNPADGVF